MSHRQPKSGVPMRKYPYALIASLTLASAAFAAAPNISKVNGSISVDAVQPYGNVSSVNGSIRLQDKYSGERPPI